MVRTSVASIAMRFFGGRIDKIHRQIQSTGNWFYKNSLSLGSSYIKHFHREQRTALITYIRNGKSSFAIIVICAIFGCAIAIVLGATLSNRESSPKHVAVQHASVEQPILAAIRQRIFNEQVLPAVAEADQTNREAAERCVVRVSESFAGYRAGIVPFTEDVTSLGTRLGVVGRGAKDWWYRSDSVRTLIAGKLEEHVFSTETLQRDLESSLTIFQQDLDANRSRMLAQIQASTGELAKSELPQLDAKMLSAEILADLQKTSAESASCDATVFAVTEVGLIIAGSAVEQLFVGILVRLGGAVGGATVSGVAVGGGGGAAAGPIGAGLGVAGGLVVGLVIDYWITENTKVTLNVQLNSLLSEMETAVLDGANANEPGGKSQPGLKLMLQNSCDQLEIIYGATLQQQVLGEEK